MPPPAEAVDELLAELRGELLQVNSPRAVEQRVVHLRALLVKEGILGGVQAHRDPTQSTSPERREGTGLMREQTFCFPNRVETVPFHIHRNAKFADEVSLEAREWVHFSRLCRHGHWHGTAHKAHDCKLCVASCGGGAWSRKKERDEENKLCPAERKRICSLLKQAMHIAVYKERRRNPYRDFKHAQGEDAVQAEKVIFDVATQRFKKKPIEVRLESDSFAKGSMRECWRMIEGRDGACVAKRYFREDDLTNYWVDTKMQAIAKHYAALFSQHPSSWATVDFIEAYMIRAAGELYSVEHYLDGRYVKYNNNSGYCMFSRSTPQAFSHYTFAQSGGTLMVVDIQGVGDLYTDPQIHTASGDDFGEGNLGDTGFALFFQTHVCNHICESFKLRPFEVYHRTPAAAAAAGASGTTVRGMAAGLGLQQPSPAASPTGRNRDRVSFRSLRKQAIVPTAMLLHGGRWDSEFEQVGLGEALHEQESSPMTLGTTQSHAADDGFDTHTNPPDGVGEESGGREHSRGAVHLRLAELHAQGRFTDGVVDVEASFYHLQLAAMYSSMSGVLGLARLYSGLGCEFLPQLVDVPEKRDLTIVLLERAFELGSYDAACALGSLLSDGNYTERSRPAAIEALQAVASGNLRQPPNPELHFGWRNFEQKPAQRTALLAEHLCALEKYAEAGELYREAADAAMAEGRGAAATKLYMKAEEIEAMVEEDEEEA
eukprot:Hpha_TRINITY_DN15681_c1_g4::TRINITY_DN15681_c1_g4_i2::g.101171::m.101171/K08292/EEF2K; elongation factor 2 kinase